MLASLAKGGGVKGSLLEGGPEPLVDGNSPHPRFHVFRFLGPPLAGANVCCDVNALRRPLNSSSFALSGVRISVGEKVEGSSRDGLGVKLIPYYIVLVKVSIQP